MCIPIQKQHKKCAFCLLNADSLCLQYAQLKHLLFFVHTEVKTRQGHFDIYLLCPIDHIWPFPMHSYEVKMRQDHYVAYSATVRT
jgi:hypothetical protein